MASKMNFKCIVCDLDTPSLCHLHKHQSLHHSAEELSLSSLTLQSFIYHQHYFQKLDSLSPSETCYFHPFCGKSPGNDKISGIKRQKHSHEYEKIAVKAEQDLLEVPEFDEKVGLKYHNTPKKQEPLRRPFHTDNSHNFSALWNAEIMAKNENFPVKAPNFHVDFLNSADGLCTDLIKLKGQKKLKRERLTGKTEPRQKKGTNRKGVVKPMRKPRISNKNLEAVNQLSMNSKPEDLQVLKIWAAKSDENASDPSPKASEVETIQQIKLQSPTVPTDMINCENALIFNPEIGSFQWNPLSFVEKGSEKADRLV